MKGARSKLQYRVFGPVEARIGDRVLDLGGPKPRTLLTSLIALRGTAVSIDSLSNILWGDQPPMTATKTIQKYVSRLRKQVGEDLVTRSGGYAMEVDSAQIDVRRFESLIASSESDGAATRDLLEQALDLWAEPYPELADTQLGITESARLGAMRLGAIERLIDLRLDDGEHRELIGWLEQLVTEFPLRERFWFQLMLALYRSERQSEALNAYQRLRRTLGEELGIEPSEELQHLEEQILLHDQRLASPKRLTHLTNLEPALTSFIGREVALAEVGQLVEANDLITLIGTAGSGKTRLAREVADRRLGEYSDGVWFVDLAPVTSPDRVPDAVASPFGVGMTGQMPTEEVLKTFLSQKEALLILDNCEHLIDRVADLVEGLLGAAPRLTLIATSRQRLGVSGEIVYEVGPLAYPLEDDAELSSFEAIELFLDRAVLADPHFQVGEEGLRHIAEIVASLDGIPLAIELAAARVRSLPPVELKQHLGERFEVLRSPRRAKSDRHRTLQAAVEWSFQLLEPYEQALLRRLSVFLGGFDMAAARAVCGFEPLNGTQVLQLLPDLVDRSLVAVSSSPASSARYFLLETMREFGQIKLDAAEAGEVRASHADYFCRFAEQAASRLRGPDQRNWLNALALDHDNLLKALRWAATTDPETAVRIAIALSRYWDAVGPRDEGHEWLRRAVELSNSVTPRLRVAALIEASDIFSSAHASQPRQYAEQALEEARAGSDTIGEARALRALAWALGLEERPDEARTRGMEALALFEEIGDRWETALCFERLGQVSYHQPQTAIEDLRQARTLYQEEGDRTREALTLYKLADRIAHSGGDLDEALSYAEESVAICDEIGNSHDGAHARLELGRILRRAGDAIGAERVLQDALDQLSRSGDERCSVRSLTALGIALLDEGRRERAEQILTESLRRGAELDEKLTSRVALAGVARIISEDQPQHATSIYAFLSGLSRDLGIPIPESTARRRSETYEDLRSRIGEDTFRQAWNCGESMSLESAIALALAATDQ